MRELFQTGDDSIFVDGDYRSSSDAHFNSAFVALSLYYTSYVNFGLIILFKWGVISNNEFVATIKFKDGITDYYNRNRSLH